MVGWGQLKDGLQPSWMLGFTFLKTILHPRLYPLFVFATSKKEPKQACVLILV
jgi:hypothetical protein